MSLLFSLLFFCEITIMHCILERREYGSIAKFLIVGNLKIIGCKTVTFNVRGKRAFSRITQCC